MNTTTPIFQPTYAKPIHLIPQVQKRVGLMGVSGSGKTTSMLTFPNPIVIDVDGNLSGHVNRKDILVLPFNDRDWVKNELKYVYNSNTEFNPISGAVKWYLEGEARKLTTGQTLCIDSWTTLQDEWDDEKARHPAYNSDNSINAFAFWADKISFSKDILEACRKLKCDVVVTFHEQDKNDVNKLNSKIEPLMQGKFNKQMGKYFTEFYRCVVKSKIDAKSNTVGGEYKWQTASTGDVSCVKTRMMNCLFEIEPHAKSIDYSGNLLPQTT